MPAEPTPVPDARTDHRPVRRTAVRATFLLLFAVGGFLLLSGPASAGSSRPLEPARAVTIVPCPATVTPTGVVIGLPCDDPCDPVGPLCDPVPPFCPDPVPSPGVVTAPDLTFAPCDELL